MKTHKSIIAIDFIYIVIMTVCSVFYMFADFSKKISGQCSFAQFVFSILVIIIFIFRLIRKKDGLPSYIYVIYSLAQLVAVFCWMIYASYTFYIFPGVKAINFLGLMVHILLIAWGINMISIKKKIRNGVIESAI
ncbi:hypothetical protein [Desulforamulus aeronauticus]|uniref:Uncharacterized protein n=1 Tax=Desulforamulus aeronauticus DSM 10349 TaxID=1121421 RepID=A0A1M6QZ53_9FIRM|nr:hypothetical protein [Desulforamulus aeronauticus]SHK25436.1 hypothetical protein SAMN02745123_01287 [Desulforamulus aeronauticus DSM 10349]